LYLEVMTVRKIIVVWEFLIVSKMSGLNKTGWPRGLSQKVAMGIPQPLLVTNSTLLVDGSVKVHWLQMISIFWILNNYDGWLSKFAVKDQDLVTCTQLTLTSQIYTFLEEEMDGTI
jgi:hypothetical protein